MTVKNCVVSVDRLRCEVSNLTVHHLPVGVVDGLDVCARHVVHSELHGGGACVVSACINAVYTEHLNRKGWSKGQNGALDLIAVLATPVRLSSSALMSESPKTKLGPSGNQVELDVHARDVAAVQRVRSR